MTLDHPTQANMIASLLDLIRVKYVFPEVAQEICRNLQNHLSAGDYAEIDDDELMALALTLHLQEVNHDEHLWVRWHADPLPDQVELRFSPEWQENSRLAASLDGFGIHRVERLQGNIGYINLRYFHKISIAQLAVASAVHLIANTWAVLLDLRQCTGGYPEMVAHLASYFFSEEPIHLTSIYWRDEDAVQEFWTQPELPGKRLVDLPLFVLTGKATFSAGEGFASILQIRQRALVVGEKTDGGAHPGVSFMLSPHYEAFIPVGRAFDPVSGKDLEGIGVIPDVLIPEQHAFTAAYDLALGAAIKLHQDDPRTAVRDQVVEAQKAAAQLRSQHKICPQCSYPNQTHRSQCINCGRVFEDGA